MDAHFREYLGAIGPMTVPPIFTCLKRLWLPLGTQPPSPPRRRPPRRLCRLLVWGR